MQNELAPRTMDLDNFMRQYPEQDGIEKDLNKRLVPDKSLTIGIQGANAGIDAVQRAWQLGHKVVWLCFGPPLPQGEPTPHFKGRSEGRHGAHASEQRCLRETDRE